MNKQIKELIRTKSSILFPGTDNVDCHIADIEKFAKLIIEETLKQVDERCYGRGENQWYYEDDKKWVRLHFGYGELTK